MGTPEFAVPTLLKISEARHDIAAVYTQPDRPKGRGRQLAHSPVKEAALRLGLTVHQPERIRRPEIVEQLASFDAEVMVVVGYGQIIPQSIINLPALGIINVHASLLPKYRGAAPIQWAIANGDSETGVTTMSINAGLDTGDMLLKRSTAIDSAETAVELAARLSRIGADLLLETLAAVEDGAVRPEPQNNAEATHAPILRKEDGLINWEMPARDIFNRCRGFLPWPGTYTTFRDQIFHIWRSKPANDIYLGIPGSMHVIGRRLLVTCGGATTLELEEVQTEGRKRVPADAFSNGHRITQHDILGEKTN